MSNGYLLLLIQLKIPDTHLITQTYNNNTNILSHTNSLSSSEVLQNFTFFIIINKKIEKDYVSGCLLSFAHRD